MVDHTSLIDADALFVILLGLIVLVPFFVSVRLGDGIGKRRSGVGFDRVILTLLSTLACIQVVEL